MSRVITSGVVYASAGTLAGIRSALKSSALSFQEQSDASPVPKFSKRYWLYGLLFSSHTVLCSPFSDHVMAVTFFSSVHSSRFVLRAFSANCLGWVVSCW